MNNYYYKRLKNIGQLDNNGQRTGFWVEYELLLDTANSSTPATIQGLDFSVDVKFPNPSKLLKSEGNFGGGQMTSRWKWYEANYSYSDSLTWQVTRETEYINGRKNGMEKQYSSGNLYRQANYSNDQITGTETYYMPPDILYLRAQWKDGVAKIATWYYESGKTKTTKDYKKFPLTKVVDYYENGNVKAKYTVYGDDEVLKGEYKSFDGNGKLNEIKKYDNGIEVKK